MMLIYEIFKVLTAFAVGAFVLCLCGIFLCHSLVLRAKGSQKFLEDVSDARFVCIEWARRTAMVGALLAGAALFGYCLHMAGVF